MTHPVVEVAQHLGNDTVRASALAATDGLSRGLPVRATGAPIAVPVGDICKGRLFNVLGQPIDNLGPVDAKEHWPIHRKPPAFEEQSTVTRNVRDRHQSHRPARPLSERRQSRPLRRRGRRQDRVAAWS